MLLRVKKLKKCNYPPPTAPPRQLSTEEYINILTECSRRLCGMFNQILGNVEEDSGECQFRFWAMFKFLVLLNLDSFCEIVLIFAEFRKGIKQLLIQSSENIFSTLLVITNVLRVNTVFLHPFSFLFSLSFYVEKRVQLLCAGSGY